MCLQLQVRVPSYSPVLNHPTAQVGRWRSKAQLHALKIRVNSQGALNKLVKIFLACKKLGD